MAFIKVYIEYVKNVIYNFDEAIYSFISLYITDNCTKLMTAITHMGSSYILTFIAVIIFFVFGANIYFKIYRKLVIYNLALTWIVNEVLKELFKRERPDILQLVTVNGYSFPSGHSMISMSFYGLLIFIFLRHIDCKHLRVSITAVLGFLIFLIGLSRIYLGVHYASDVIAGFIFGIMWLWLTILLMNRFYIAKYSLKG